MSGNAVLIDGWLDWLRAGQLSPATIRNRKYALNRLAREHDLPLVTMEDVQDHLASLPGGAWSKQGHLAAIRSFFHFCAATGRCPTDPTILIRSIRTPPGIPRPCPEDVLARALATADERTRFMLLLGAYAGLRRNEIASLHARDVRGDTLVIVGKGGKAREIPIHPRLRPYTDALAAEGGWAFPSDYVWGHHITHDTVAAHVCAALGDGWTTHSLRHRFATQAYRGTHDLRAVQQLLGHTKPETTARYTLIDDDALTAAVRAVA